MTIKKYNRIIRLRYKDNSPQYNPLMYQNETLQTKNTDNATTLLDNSPYLPATCKVAFNSFSLSVYNPQKTPKTNIPTKHKRGDILNFSRKSRRRMLLKLSTINYEAYNTRLFFTCTFHDKFPTSKDEVNRLLFATIKRIERLDDNLSIIWRIELQKRGAPHFHFILLFQRFYTSKEKVELSKKLKNIWGDLTIHLNNYAYTIGSDLRELNSNHKTFNYISKYSSKSSADERPVKLGRIWGVRGFVIESKPLEFECSFDFAEKLKELILQEMRTKFQIRDEYQNYILTYDDVKFIMPYEVILTFLRATAEILDEKNYESQIYKQANLFEPHY